VARAVYKLKEVDEKYRLLKPGQRVLDLGCSPGSWLQYIASRVGPGGLVVGVDAAPLAIEAVPPLYFVPGEITSLDLETIIAISPVFDLVVSDLAPKTTGIRQVDQQRSLELATLAWEWARRLLREGGHFLVKVFEGPDTPGLAAVLMARPRSALPESPPPVLVLYPVPPLPWRATDATGRGALSRPGGPAVLQPEVPAG